MVRRGKALRRSIGLVGAPLPVAFDHLLRRDGNTSATAIARKPPHGPMRAESRESRTPDLGRAMALRIIPPMAVHGATSLQRRTTEVRRRPASLPRPTTTRPRAAEELRRQGRTQLQARAIPLRDRIQASAVSAAAELPRRDRTRAGGYRGRHRERRNGGRGHGADKCVRHLFRLFRLSILLGNALNAPLHFVAQFDRDRQSPRRFSGIRLVRRIRIPEGGRIIGQILNIVQKRLQAWVRRDTLQAQVLQIMGLPKSNLVKGQEGFSGLLGGLLTKKDGAGWLGLQQNVRGVSVLRCLPEPLGRLLTQQLVWRHRAASLRALGR